MYIAFTFQYGHTTQCPYAIINCWWFFGYKLAPIAEFGPILRMILMILLLSTAVLTKSLSGWLHPPSNNQYLVLEYNPIVRHRQSYVS